MTTSKKTIAPSASILCAAFSLCLLPAIFTGCVTSEKIPSAEGTETTGIKAQLTNKTWILCGIQFDGRFIPLEPAHGANNVLVFYPDGRFETSTGTTFFSGTWKVKAPESDESAGIEFAVDSASDETHPNQDAVRFERAYIDSFSTAKKLDAYSNQFSLYDKDGKTLLKFILNNPDW